jgi:hypothetical protein
MHGCRLQVQYSRAPMPFLLYSLCPVYALKSEYKQFTQMSVSMYTTIAIIPGCAFTYVRAQSTYKYRVLRCMSLRRNWDSPTPSLASECAPPPNQGGGGTLAAGEGGGGVPIPTTVEKLSTLPTLCVRVLGSR